MPTKKEAFRLVELFSGIGSQAKAFARVSKSRNFDFVVSNTCEWDIHAIVAYDYIHNGFSLDKKAIKMTKVSLIKELSKLNLSTDGKEKINKNTLKSFSVDVLSRIYSSILRTNNLINVEDVSGKDLPNRIGLLTYSFPCQDLSNVGALHGYNKGIDKNAHTRSGLLWEVERMLIERKRAHLDLPKFLLLENVTALEAKRHANNFKNWIVKLEKLGYINHINRLYAPNFGIPQHRKRLLMLSVYVGNDKKYKDKVLKYFKKHDLNSSSYVKTLKIKKKSLSKFLKLDNDKKTIYYKEALLCQPNNTKSRKTIWNKNSKILDEKNRLKEMVQTITTKQDRHPNSGNIYFNPKNGKSKFRFLTPRECFLLMGFDEKDFEILIKNNFYSRKNSYFFSRDKLYKLAGNSIVVNMLEAIFNQVIDLNNILKGDKV